MNVFQESQIQLCGEQPDRVRRSSLSDESIRIIDWLERGNFIVEDEEGDITFMTQDNFEEEFPEGLDDFDEHDAVMTYEPSVPEVKAHEVLQTAVNEMRERAILRDQPNGERSAKRASEILSAWTGFEWTELDVWKCLMAVKMARHEQGQFHIDDLVDLAAYSGLLAEAESRLQ